MTAPNRTPTRPRTPTTAAGLGGIVGTFVVELTSWLLDLGAGVDFPDPLAGATVALFAALGAYVQDHQR